MTNGQTDGAGLNHVLRRSELGLIMRLMSDTLLRLGPP
jgi:hypothetical protein